MFLNLLSKVYFGNNFLNLFSIIHFQETTKVQKQHRRKQSFFDQGTRVNRGRSDSILPQRDIAAGIFYGRREEKKRNINKESNAVARQSCENCCSEIYMSVEIVG